jgi:magnesium chelatase subunit I
LNDLALNLIEQIGFEARESDYIDEKSGVSARMSITILESLVSTAELRMLGTDDAKTQLRLADFYGVIPAITGKVELVYEGEQEGAEGVALMLINDAIKTTFNEFFPKIEKLEKPNEKNAYTDIVNWFLEGNEFELLDTFDEKAYQSALDSVSSLQQLIETYAKEFIGSKEVYFLKELILWGLVENKKLSLERLDNGLNIKDTYGNILKGFS